jgi:hypothetical protein
VEFVLVALLPEDGVLQERARVHVRDAELADEVLAPVREAEA